MTSIFAVRGLDLLYKYAIVSLSNSNRRTVHPLVVRPVLAVLDRAGVHVEALDQVRVALTAGNPVPESDQRRLLNEVLARLGPESVLAAGAGLRDEPHPVIQVLRDAPSPPELIARARRLESYLHIGHRTTFTMTGTSMTVRHLPRAGREPDLAESLFVCGAHASFLDLLADDVTISVTDASAPPVTLWRHGRPARIPGLERATGWTVTWRADDRPDRPAISDDAWSPTERLRQLVVDDPAMHWTLTLAAHHLALSRRTLQRRLAQDGVGIGEVVRATRITLAANYLLRTDLPVGLIGYLTGFCDPAHFSRGFAAVHGLPPGQWRTRSGAADDGDPVRVDRAGKASRSGA